MTEIDNLIAENAELRAREKTCRDDEVAMSAKITELTAILRNAKMKIEFLQTRVTRLEVEMGRRNTIHVGLLDSKTLLLTEMRERIKELEGIHKQFIEQNADLECKWQMSMDAAESNISRRDELLRKCWKILGAIDIVTSKHEPEPHNFELWLKEIKASDLWPEILPKDEGKL